MARLTHTLTGAAAHLSGVGWSLRRRCAARWARLHARADAGYTTETVLITALLVALAIATLAVIGAKVLAAARAISLG